MKLPMQAPLAAKSLIWGLSRGVVVVGKIACVSLFLFFLHTQTD